jgi:hypothetical protein
LLHFFLKNGHNFWKIEKDFPALPQNTITKIYRARCERLRLLINHEIPKDIRWIIEAKVWLLGESSNFFYFIHAWES